MRPPFGEALTLWSTRKVIWAKAGEGDAEILKDSSSVDDAERVLPEVGRTCRTLHGGLFRHRAEIGGGLVKLMLRPDL
jgi:hypothetical protein